MRRRAASDRTRRWCDFRAAVDRSSLWWPSRCGRDRTSPRLSAGGTAAAVGPAISLAILPFRNASGDSSLDWLGPSLAEMLRTDVGRSARVRTVPSDRLHQILRDLRISADSTFDPADAPKAREVQQRETPCSGGSTLKFGNEIRIDATLEDVKRAAVQSR